MSSTAQQPESQSRWPHRLAVLLACATFPLIWVGGLVTTYDAGMAVPDWPTTYGYNLFLYPWQTWVFGPWDLFIEHGHRLLGAIVGLLTIALAAALWARDGRHWMRWLGLAAVAGVILQGVLGGLRVRLDARLLAQIHGCVGPAFFALAAALAVCTSRRWLGAGGRRIDCRLSLRERTFFRGAKDDEGQRSEAGVGRLGGFRVPHAATATAALAYLQLLLGSQLRHLPVTADATMFRLAVFFHLVVAAALTAHVWIVWWRAEREAPRDRWLLRPARCLAALIGVQLALGGGAWVVNYGWPAWFSGYDWAAGFVVTREGFAQALVTTGHVACGSLILATSVVLTLRSWKVAAERSALRRAGAVGSGLRAVPCATTDAAPPHPRNATESVPCRASNGANGAEGCARNATERVPYRASDTNQLVHEVAVA